MPGAPILVAVSQQARPRLSSILHGHQLHFCATLAEVVAAVRARRFDLAIVGTHFDESTAFEVLKFLTARDEGLRVVCVRGRPFAGLGASTIEVFRTACLALGASLVLDVLAFNDDERGNAHLRRLLVAELDKVRV